MVRNLDWVGNIITVLIALLMASGFVVIVFRTTSFAWLMDRLTGRRE